MKFAQHLSSHLTPEWRKQYIDYDGLKDKLYEYLDQAPEGGGFDPKARTRFLAGKTEEFLQLCDEELVKINLFFGQKISEAKAKWHEISHQVQTLRERLAAAAGHGTASHSGSKSAMNHSDSGLSDRRHSTVVIPLHEAWKYQKLQKLQESVRLAFTEYYLSLILIQNFQELNFTGFRKILKKHDKLLETNAGMAWRQANVFPAAFHTDKSIDDLILQTENTFIELEGGNRSKAMSRLRVQPMSEKQSPWTTFRLGLFLGAFLVIACLILINVYSSKLPNEPKWVAVRLFRGFFILFAHAFLFGLNVYGWQTAGVNHVLIFGIDPRDHLRYQTVMEISVTLIFVCGAFALAYLYQEVFYPIPKVCIPLVMLAIILLWFLNPFNFGYRSSRFWLLRKLYVCFTPLCHSVVFPDFWLADQMNSLVTVFLDFEYFLCFYAFEVDWLNGMQVRFLPRDLVLASLDNQTDDISAQMARYDRMILAGNQTSFADFGVNPLNGNDVCSTSIYGIRPLVAIIPACIRFFQCIRRYSDTNHKHPHLTNAGKYSTTFFVVFFGTLTTWHYKHALESLNQRRHKSPFFAIWVVCYLVSTSYTYCWDIFMDWGLCDCKNAGENKFLREELVYRKKWYYYFAIVSDLVLRLSWTLNISLGEQWIYDTDYLVCGTAVLECFRRFVWNYFRLENEHLNNCGEFRAVRDISLKPIPWSEQELIENIGGPKPKSGAGHQHPRRASDVLNKGGLFGRILQGGRTGVARGKGGSGAYLEPVLDDSTGVDDSSRAESPDDCNVLIIPSNASTPSREQAPEDECCVSRRSNSSGSEQGRDGGKELLSCV